MKKLTTEEKMRLANARQASYASLDQFRVDRKKFVQLFTGSHYNCANDKRVPLNLYEMAISTYQWRIAAGTPDVLVSSRVRQNDFSALMLQNKLRQELEEMEFAAKVRGWIQDALFLIGIMRVSLVSGIEIMWNDVRYDVGKTSMDLVSFDDFAMDTTAKRWEDCQFLGDMFRMTDSEAKAVFGNRLDPEKHELDSNAQLSHAETATIGSGDWNSDAVLEPRRVYWRYHLPRRGSIVITNESGTKILDEVEYEGPPSGAYKILQFTTVPDNLMPLSFAANMYDLAESVNVLLRKVFDQAKRQKSFVAGDKGEQHDGEGMVEVKDGEVRLFNQPQALSEMSVGGVNPATHAATIFLKDLFSYAAGNLDIAAGLSPQSQTATQDSMLNENSSLRFRHMEELTYAGVKDLVRSIAYYIWTDPIQDYTVKLSLPKYNTEQLWAWTAAQRMKSNFFDNVIDIVPFSMRDRSPGERVNTIVQTLQSVVGPFMQQMNMQGIEIDFAALIEKLSVYTGVPELNTVVRSGGPELREMALQSTMNSNSKPTETKRIYERINRPGATQKGKDMALMQSLLGKGQQQTQIDQIGRSSA